MSERNSRPKSRVRSIHSLSLDISQNNKPGKTMLRGSSRVGDKEPSVKFV